MSAKTYSMKPGSYANVTVAKSPVSENILNVFLHGNLVLAWDKVDNVVEMGHCNWITTTTRQVINTGLSNIGINGSVSIKAGKMYFNGVEIVRTIIANKEGEVLAD